MNQNVFFNTFIKLARLLKFSFFFCTIISLTFLSIRLEAQEIIEEEQEPPNFLQSTYGFFRVMGGIPCRAFIGNQNDNVKDNLLGSKENEWVSWVGPKHIVSGTPIGKPQRQYQNLDDPNYTPHLRKDFIVGVTRNTRSGKSNRDPGPLPGNSPSFFQYSIEHQDYDKGGKFLILPVINDETGDVGAWAVFSAEKTRIALGHTVDGRTSISYNFPGTNGLPATYKELSYLRRVSRPIEKFWFFSGFRTKQLQTPYREIVKNDPREEWVYIGESNSYDPSIKDPNNPRFYDRWDFNTLRKGPVSNVKTHYYVEETCQIKSVYTPEHFDRFSSNLPSECSVKNLNLKDPEDAIAPWCIAELIHKGQVELEVYDSVQSALRWLPIRGTAENIVDCQETGSAYCWSLAAGSFVGDLALLAPLVKTAGSGVRAFAPARITSAAKAKIKNLTPEKVRETMTRVHQYTASDVFGVLSIPIDALNAGLDAAAGNISGLIGHMLGGGSNLVFMKPVPVGTSPNIKAPSIGVKRGETVANNSNCTLSSKITTPRKLKNGNPGKLWNNVEEYPNPEAYMNALKNDDKFRKALEENGYFRVRIAAESDPYDITTMNLAQIAKLDPELGKLPKSYLEHVADVYNKRLNLTEEEIQDFIRKSLEMSDRTILTVITSRGPPARILGGVNYVKSSSNLNPLPLEESTNFRVPEPYKNEGAVEIGRLTGSGDTILLLAQAAQILKNENTAKHVYINTSKVHHRLYQRFGIPMEVVDTPNDRDVILYIKAEDFYKLSNLL